MHPRPRLRLILLLVVACALGIVASPLQAATEVRILIDVSGSMQRTDPQNLRGPALRLIAELLPMDVTAGVWLFAGETEVLIPLGTVDAEWKRQARARLNRIHSRGLLTDIEGALNTAIADWSAASADDQRYIIMLSDGLVDVAGGEDASAASRQRLLVDLAPRLRTLGARLNLVGLSNEIDAELFAQLADATGGWYEQAASASALQRAFLRMIEQTATPVTVPLRENRFRIDAAIAEFTLLAFRSANQPISLFNPRGEEYTEANHPAAINWSQDGSYDLVTVRQPIEGDWRLGGSFDSDNRVAILTDLGMAQTPIPSTLIEKQPLTLEAWLTNHGQPITDQDILRLTRARAKLTSLQDETRSFRLPLMLDPDGWVYRGQFSAGTIAPAGLYQLNINIATQTFTRQLEQRVRVTEPSIQIHYAPFISEGVPKLIVTLEVDEQSVKPSSLFGFIQLAGPNKHTLVIPVEGARGAETRYDQPVRYPGQYRATARIRAQTQVNSSINFMPEPQLIQFDFPEQLTSSADGSSAAEFSWLDLMLILIGANLLLASSFGLVYMVTRPPQSKGAPKKNSKPAASAKKTKSTKKSASKRS